MGPTGTTDDDLPPAVEAYLAATDPRGRALFERVHDLVLDVHPDAATVISYNMPTYVVGASRLHVGVWRHGLSVYGWRQGQDGGFAARHPDLVGDKGTIRLTHAAAATVTDDELRDLARASLDP